MIDGLMNEALNFTGAIPDFFNEDYCHFISLFNSVEVGEFNQAEKILWTLGQQRLESGKDNEGIFFFNEAYKSFGSRHGGLRKDRTYAINTAGVVFYGNIKPVFININGPIGDEC